MEDGLESEVGKPRGGKSNKECGVETQEGWEGARLTRKQREGLASSRGPVGMARRRDSGRQHSGLGTWGKVGSIPQSGRSKAGPGEIRESEVRGDI